MFGTAEILTDFLATNYSNKGHVHKVTYLLFPSHDVLQEVDIGAVALGSVQAAVLREKFVELVLALEPLLKLTHIGLHHLGWKVDLGH